MEHISIKLESAIAKQIERDMREFNYSTKTEFIRESIRDKLKKLAEEREKKKAWQALYAPRGIFKGKGEAKTDEEFRKLREDAGQEFIEMLEKKFSQK
jgi:Arc/MetJ-type ribon-helix-helix transcriptional regulator